MKFSIRAILGFALCAATALAANPPHYKVVDKVKLGGEGGWDYLYVDSAAHRLYISRGTHVMVVNTDDNKVVGDIPNTPGVHGVAISKSGKAFTSNGRDNTVTPFDPKTLKTSEPIKVGDRPDAIVYDSYSGRVFTFNAAGKDATAVDAETGKVAGSVPIGGKPEFSQSNGKGMMWVNNEDAGVLVQFDPKSLKVTNQWKMDGCEEPSGLALDAKHEILFSGCRSKIMAITDGKSGKQIAKIPIGAGVDACAFDPGTQLAFSSNGEGNITVIHEDSPTKFSVVQTVDTQRGARTMTLDPKTHKLYTVTAEFGPPPAATADNPRPRPSMVPDSFTLIVLAPE